jgi:hypothetical protein
MTRWFCFSIVLLIGIAGGVVQISFDEIGDNACSDTEVEERDSVDY